MARQCKLHPGLQAFLDELAAQRKPDGDVIFKLGRVDAEPDTPAVTHGDNRAYLASISAANPGCGVGTALMHHLVGLADRFGTELTLLVNPRPPLGPKHIDTLRDWYQRFGFVETGYARMKRVPRTVPAECGREGPTA